jgi:cellulose synthase operon protein C
MRGLPRWAGMQEVEPMRRASRTAALSWVAALGLFAQAVSADIDYDSRRAPALRRCDEAQHRGRVEAARDCYRPLLRSGDALIRAEAAFALGDLRNANELFRAAVAADERAVLPRIRWGRMFLAAGQQADAARLFQEAVQLDEKDQSARLALARVTADRYDGDVRETIASLLAENPDLIEAQLIASGVAIERGRYDEAELAARTALRLATAQKYPPLEAQTLLATIEVMRNRDPSSWTRAALDYNPRHGAMFETLGHFEIMRRRYREADVWLQRAAQVQPDLWSARRELGLNLMRLGRIAEARPHLVAAYEGDPFSTATVNTLRLLDSLEKFDVLHVATPALNLQLHNTEAATLGPYVEQLARDSIATFSRRYGFAPTEPITIEIYPDHDDFAVRTAGLPGIGLLGVTFGHLVAMDSPSGRKTGEFHWGSTLWHEMAHVFTLSVTRHRVPRWLSEGLSVFEEWTTGPTPGVSITPDVLDAFASGKLLPVATLDDGFMRPGYEGQVQNSYMQAGLMCLFAEEKFGFPKVVEFLRSFTGEVSTEAAVRDVFRIAPEEFDRQFQAFMRARFSAYLADPKRWIELMRRGHTMLEAHNWVAAREAAQAAILMLPEFTSSGSAYEILAGTEEGVGNAAAAIAAWQSWRKAGGWDPQGLRKLGALLLAAKRLPEATDVLAAVNYADPLAVDGHDRLGQLLIEQNRGADALREYQVLLALRPPDTAAANFGLARAYRLTGDAKQARRHLLESLDTAPNFRPAQRLLLEMTGDRTP